MYNDNEIGDLATKYYTDFFTMKDENGEAELQRLLQKTWTPDEVPIITEDMVQ